MLESDVEILKDYLGNKKSILACYQQKASRVCAKMIMKDPKNHIYFIKRSMPKLFSKKTNDMYIKSFLGTGDINIYRNAMAFAQCSLIGKFEDCERLLDKYTKLFLND